MTSSYEASLNNPLNVVGIASFLSSDHGGVDIREIEKSLVENEEQQTIQDAPQDIVAEFKNRLSFLESSLGISLGDDSADGGQADDGGDPDGGAAEGEYDHKQSSPAARGSSPYSEPPRGGAAGGILKRGGYGSGDYEAADAPPSRSVRFAEAPDGGAAGSFRDPDFARMSSEQRKQRILQDALSNIGAAPMTGGDKFSLDFMKMNDKRNSLMEEINMLKMSLVDDGVNIEDIPAVGASNSIDEIENVYKQLRYRNDHARYCGFANEIAQVGASGLEYLFDGEKKYFGMKPDLTGWSSTLNIKMRRLNYETSSIVGEAMRSNDMGNFSRLCLELIPSMILHMKMRANKAGKTATRPSNNDVQAAISGIRGIEPSRRRE